MLLFVASISVLSDRDANRLDSPIAFVDLAAQRRRIGASLEKAIGRVLDHTQFVMGPEVAELERRLAEFSGAGTAVTCASGTDALVLSLMASGVGAGDAVFVPAFTFTATAAAVVPVGATPVFTDVRADTFTMDAASLGAAVDGVLAQGGLRPAAVIAVDLFGQPADYSVLGVVADRHGLRMLADAAQSFGAKAGAGPVGTLAPLTTTSFFPAKPLGCYGDGGAVLTDDDVLAGRLRALRQHGRAPGSREPREIGMNSRLDTIQAAVLLEKLRVYEWEIQARDKIARRYSEGLAEVVDTPILAPGNRSVWAQYTVLLEGRDTLAADLKERGIPTAIHYPKPLHETEAYRGFPVVPGGTPVATDLSARVLSLPFHADLDPAVQDRIIVAVRDSVAGVGEAPGRRASVQAS